MPAKPTTPAKAIQLELRALDKSERKIRRDDTTATAKRDRIQREMDRGRARQDRTVAAALKRIDSRRAILEARLASQA
jgi:hypothetical protein